MDARFNVADEAMSRILAKLRRESFFGTLEIVFEGGRIVRLKKHETMLEENVKEFIEA